MNVFAKLKKIISAKMLAGFFMASVALFMVAPVTLQIKEIEVQNKVSKSFHINTNVNIAYAQVPTECEGFSVFTSIVQCTVFGIFWIIFQTSAALVKFAGWILDIIIAYTLESLTYNNQQGWITQGWAMIRDFINIFFIMILLTIAGNMIVNKGGDTWKKQLISIAIAALLINFSLFFVKVVIDGGNITARVFYRAMDLQESDIPSVDGNVAKFDGAGFPLKVRSITAAVINKSNALRLVTAIGGSSNTLSAFNSSWVVIYSYLIIGSIMYIFMIYMFLNIAFYFFARTFGLWFLMIASPLAFLSSVNIPWLKKMFDLPALKEIGFESYTSNLAKMAFQPAVFLFMMYLTVVSINLIVFTSSSATIAPGASADVLFKELIFWMIPLIIVFGIVIMTKKVTDKFSTSFGEFLASGAKSVVGAVGGLVMGGAGLAARSTLGAAFAGSKTLGQGAAVARQARMNMATGKGNAISNRLQLLRGNTMKSMQKYGKEGSWDARDLGKKLGGFKKYGEKVGMKLDTGVDFESTKIFGKDYLDVGRIPLGYGYNLSSFIKEGREGGLIAHGNKVDEYYQKLADEIKKDKQEEFDIAMKEKRVKRDEAKKNMEDEKKDIVDTAFNGNEKNFNEFDKNNQKMRNSISNIDGGYSDNTTLDFATNGIKDAVDGYRANPIKNPLSSVIKRILDIETAQGKMFEFALAEINNMPAVTTDERNAKALKLREHRQSKIDFAEMIGKAKASLTQDFAENKTYNVADLVTDTDDIKKEKKAKRDDAAKLVALETAHGANTILADPTLYLDERIEKLKKFEGVEKRTREEEIKQNSGSITKKIQQVQRIVNSQNDAIAKSALITNAVTDFNTASTRFDLLDAQRITVEKSIKDLGDKNNLLNRKNTLEQKDIQLQQMKMVAPTQPEKDAIQLKIDANRLEMNDNDAKIATFDADITTLKATAAANAAPLKRAVDEKERLKNLKEKVERETKNADEKLNIIMNEKKDKEEEYDKFLERQFGKDKDEMAVQLKEYESKNTEYKKQNMNVSKQEEQLREESKSDFKDIKKHTQDQRIKINNISRRVSEVATLGTFRMAAEALNDASFEIDNAKAFAEKKLKDMSNNLANAVPTGSAFVDGARSIVQKGVQKAAVSMESKLNRDVTYRDKHIAFTDRIQGMEIDKDGNRVASSFNKTKIKAEAPDKKDEKKDDKK